MVTNKKYSKELIQLNKLYKNKDKFGGIRNNFTFKLSIFYDKCQFVRLFSNVYLENDFVVLKIQVQTQFYTNRESIVLFNNFCWKIWLFFEGPK